MTAKVPPPVDAPSRAIARAPASGDQSLIAHRAECEKWANHVPGPAERERLAGTLGAALREMRAERGLSTRALAVRSTVARSTVTRLERGERRPRPAILAALAYGLDHEHPGPLAERLTAAAGDSLRPDTPQGLRRRARRLGKAKREAKQLRAAVGRQAGYSRIQARRLTIAALRAIPVPPRGDITRGSHRRMMAEFARSEAMMRQSKALDRRADHIMRTLEWPYHPLWTAPLEQYLDS